MNHARDVASAQIELGNLHMYGDRATGFPVCHATGLKLLTAAAESDESTPNYRTGLGVTLSTLNVGSPLAPALRDNAAAVKWLTLAAKHDEELDAQMLLSRHLYEAIGVKQDIPGAVALWQKTAISDPLAVYHLGYFAYHGTHPDIVPTNKKEGIRLLTIAAEKAIDRAQIELGRYYDQTGAYGLAEKWHLAASQLTAEGKFYLAEFYRHNPDYIPPTMTEKQVDLKILANYSGAAKGGYLEAKYALAVTFLDGYRSIAKDFDKAWTFLLECINDDPNVKTEPSRAALLACFSIGNFALGLTPSKMKTSLGFTIPLEWFSFGAEHGSSECQCTLAEL
jgi:TPR repeat protein